MKNRVKQLAKFCFLGIQLLVPTLLFVVIFSDLLVVQLAANRVTDNWQDLPKGRVALVLGTSPYTVSKGVNPYFAYRMDAAVALYNRGYTHHLLLSGDNRHQSYNEPEDMKKALRKRGVPDSVITLDYAGFRTLDSVVRARKVFQQDKILIVSQKFHNQRAVAIARLHGIDAYGFNAKDVSVSYGMRVQLRELGARTKLLLDVLLTTKPKFLGDPIFLPES